VTLNLALALVERGASVGLLDADLYGPDIPAMLGLTRTRDMERWTVWRKDAAKLIPIERRGLKLMSAGFLLGDRQVMPGQSQTLPFVLRQLVIDVKWGALDFLLLARDARTVDLGGRRRTARFNPAGPRAGARRRSTGRVQRARRGAGAAAGIVIPGRMLKWSRR